MQAAIRPHRKGLVALSIVTGLILAGCANVIAGTALPIGAAMATQSQDPLPEGPNGLRAGVTIPATIVVEDTTKNSYDTIATATIADLYDFYGSTFPATFGKEFVPAKELHSFDSTSGGKICGASTLNYQNAFYAPRCDLIAWDRGVLLPELDQKIGQLAAPTIIAHEVGHLVHNQLGLPREATTILREQQADCYAGAYWRWVADGKSTRFDISHGEGSRQILSALLYIGDPLGLPASTSQAHGSAFDRSVALILGYTEGARRCHAMDQAEVDRRITQTGFTVLPQNFSNIPITEAFITNVTDTMKTYFTAAVPDFVAPQVVSFTGKAPTCADTPNNEPVFWCRANNTIYYDLNKMIEIGTPEAAWKSTNGDFSAVIVIASRYALAAQATGGAPTTGNQVGLRSLCYAGTWASWLKRPQGPRGLMVSPNDFNKSVYQVMRSPLAGADVVGKTSIPVIYRVQALHIGITTDISRCYQVYGSVT